MVTTGITSIEEDLDNLPDKWELVLTECTVYDVDPDTFELSNPVTIDDEGSTANLAPWQVLDCTFTNEKELQGHTPGFWRNNADKKNAMAWTEDPETLFKDVFDYDGPLAVNPSFTAWKLTKDGFPTLFGAVTAQGGDINALARHCVAAKLNAESDDDVLDYPLELSEVIDLCNEGLNDPSKTNANKDILAGYNEQENSDISQQYKSDEWLATGGGWQNVLP